MHVVCKVRWGAVVLGAVIVALAWVSIAANVLTPPINEDFDLQLPTTHVSRMLHMCAAHYMGWNARIGDILSLMFSVMPFGVFNVINAFSAMMLGVVVIGAVRVMARGRTVTPWYVAASLMFLFAVCTLWIPRPGEIFLWRTGSANYLYPTIFYVAYMVPWLYILFRRRDVFADISRAWVRRTAIGLYGIAGLVVAHGNENVSPVFLGYLLVSAAIVYRRDGTLPMWVYCSGMCVVVGTALLLGGSSTQHRRQFYAEAHHTPTSSVALMQRNALSVAQLYWQYFHILIYVTIVSVLLAAIAKVWENRSVVVVAFCCMAGSFAVALILAAAPYREPRAFFVSGILLAIGVMYVFAHMSWRWHVAAVVCVGTIILLHTPFYREEYRRLHIRAYEQHRRIAHVRAELARGVQTDIVIDPMTISSSPLVLVGGSADEAERMTRYFRLKNHHIYVRQQ